METVTNVANAATEAAKAAWGVNEAAPSHQEPISGVKGDVSKGEPYDAGNMDEAAQERLSESQSRPVENVPLKSSEGVMKQSEGITQEPEGEGVPRMSERETPSQSKLETPSQPNVETPAKSKLETPGQSKVPDPSPIDSTPSHAAETTTATTATAGETDDTSSGTGEQYVRTTGFAADGGDFDATKPGAGREADRLMEEKGIPHDEGSHHASSSHSDGKGKRSLGERIKSKLHVH